MEKNHSPLIPANIVELPTLVKPKLAFNDQFAAIHAKQKNAANLAVSDVVSGVISSSKVGIGRISIEGGRL